MEWTLEGNTAQGQEIAKREQAADAPFLGAKFWQEGTEITCEIVSVHNSNKGKYVAARLIEPEFVEVYDNDGSLNEHSTVRLGNLAGLNFARKALLKELPNTNFVEGDVLKIICTGITPASKEGYSDSPDFALKFKPSPARKSVAKKVGKAA